MRKFILIAALVLVSATAQAGVTRGLTLASNDEPAAAEQPKAVEAPKAAEAPKYVERPRLLRPPNSRRPTRPEPSPTRTPNRSRLKSRSASASRPKRASSPNCIATAFIGKPPMYSARIPARSRPLAGSSLSRIFCRYVKQFTEEYCDRDNIRCEPTYGRHPCHHPAIRGQRKAASVGSEFFERCLYRCLFCSPWPARSSAI